jgi:hypothetical protein
LVLLVVGRKSGHEDARHNVGWRATRNGMHAGELLRVSRADGSQDLAEQVAVLLLGLLDLSDVVLERAYVDGEFVEAAGYQFDPFGQVVEPAIRAEGRRLQIVDALCGSDSHPDILSWWMGRYLVV